MEQEKKTDIFELLKDQQAQIQELSGQLASRLAEAKKLLESNSLDEKQTRDLLRTMNILKNKMQILRDKNIEINEAVVKMRQTLQELKAKAEEQSQAKADE